MVIPVRKVDDLPKIGANETPTLDFKKTVDPSNLGELAKDIAAFANSEGGAIIVGAVEEDDRLARYEPLPEEFAGKVKRAYDHAQRDRCLPRPVVETHMIGVDSGFVLTVNVKRFEGQLVAVVLPRGEHSPVDGFWFPHRSGTHTVALSPDELPRFMLLDERRRVATWLSEIPPGERVLTLQLPTGNPTMPVTETEVRLELGDQAAVLQRNAVTFLILSSGCYVTIPAENIKRVWRTDYRWHVRAAVSLRRNSRGESTAIPLP